MSASSKKKLRKEQNAAQLTQKQLQEQKEAKKLKHYTVTFVTVMVLIVCLGIGMIGFTAVNNSGVFERNTKAVKIGDRVLSNAQLNYYFIDAIQNTYNDWYKEYGEYMSVMTLLQNKLSLTAPLNQQLHPTDAGRTYADFFVDKAIEEAKRAYVLNDMAAAENFALTEEDLSDIDDLISSMTMLSKAYGYNNLNGYLKAMYGNGANKENYREYVTVTKLASKFQTNYQDSLKYTADQLNAYNQEHFNEFSSFTFRYFYLTAEDFIAHAEDDTSHNHNEEDTAAALKKAEAAANILASCGAVNADEFDSAIKALEGLQGKEDTKKATQKKYTLYTAINEDIAKWVAEEGRKANDIKMIPYTTKDTDEDGNETTKTNGYFVVMFEKREDNNEFLVDVRHILIKFEGGTKNETTGETTYSEAEKKTAYDKIVSIKETWQAGDATEDSFKELAKKESKDPGSASSGGLYTEVYPHKMVDSFNDWCFDPARETGDVEIVESEHGYHLIYFVKTGEVTYRNQMIEKTMRDNDFETWFNALPGKTTHEVLDPSRLSLDIAMGS